MINHKYAYATMPAYSARLVRSMRGEAQSHDDIVLVSVAGGLQVIRLAAAAIPTLFNNCPCDVTATLLREAYVAYTQFPHEEN